jgi:hypothetical protein
MLRKRALALLEYQERVAWIIKFPVHREYGVLLL